VELTAPQKKAYKEMKDTLGAVLASGVINAVNEAVLRIKLLQISLGAVYDTEKKSHHVDCSSRLKVLEELIEQTEEKVIVFAPFTTIVDKVYEELKKRYDVEKINGSVSQNKRTEIFRNFQNTSSPRIIVADPGTMSHGLTLTAANTIVWYGPTDKPEVYTQANARINRAGQKNHTLIAQLSATDAERETFRRLDAKENMQGLVLQLIKTGDHND
jgi:SNF2 family DNA or RNA helicase